ncbi:MAG: ribbon-helix-helix protein, CopG family [Actinomycetota bacterium]
MSKAKQVAFQIDNEDLEAIDALTVSEFASRAEVIRVAIHDWLARRRAEAVDAALAEGYRLYPPSGPEEAWADRSLEGLDAAHLDW